MKVTIVGVTGLVGRVMLNLLEKRNFTVDRLYPVASEHSINKKIIFNGKKHTIKKITSVLKLHPDIALFSAGSSTSKEWAPRFANLGTTVIDNSSAWRMDTSKKLIVPEINANLLTKYDKIIANPNCSTIQLVMVLYPIHKKYLIKRVVVNTYQSVSGTGQKAVDQLISESKGENLKSIYPHPIYKNALPQCDIFEENGYTKEELKIINEPKKIMDLKYLNLTATAVRIPVIIGHSESVNISFEKEFSLDEVRNILECTPEIIVKDDTNCNEYPMPIYSEGKDEVFIGRLRRDFSNKKTLQAWIVADNLRKGAATNAVKIAEYLLQNKLLI